MIEGLQVTLFGNKLQELCKERAANHRKRAEFYRSQIAAFDDSKLEHYGTKTSGGDPLDAMETQLQGHENDAKEMEFIAENLDVSETYRLGWDDLRKLGIVKARY